MLNEAHTLAIFVALEPNVGSVRTCSILQIHVIVNVTVGLGPMWNPTLTRSPERKSLIVAHNLVSTVLQNIKIITESSNNSEYSKCN